MRTLNLLVVDDLAIIAKQVMVHKCFFHFELYECFYNLLEISLIFEVDKNIELMAGVFRI